MKAEKIRRALNLLKEGVDAGAMPGGTVCVFVKEEMVLHEPFGTIDGWRPVLHETIYDLASLTKPLATAASLLILVEDGHITLTTPISEFFGNIPENMKGITVHHLLTHTSGLPSWIACYDSGLTHDDAIATILKQTTVPPGTKYEYSCLGFILLHRIIEMVSGKTLDRFAQEHVFTPLGLASLTYHPNPLLHAYIAPTIAAEGPDKEKVLVGIVHDGNARGLGGVSGNAGLFGTVLDVARFGESLHTKFGNHLFGSHTRARIFANQVKPDVGSHTLFFFAQGNGYCPAGDLLSPQTVGHSGYTGTMLTIDPTNHLTVALLTNSVFGSGKASFLTYRRRFLNVLASAL